MTDADNTIAGDSVISPRLRQYIKRHGDKLREDLGTKIDSLFAQWSTRMEAKIQESIIRAQQGPTISEAIESLREEVRLLSEAVRETNRRLDRLATSVDRRFELYLGHIRTIATRATEPTRARDEQGRLIDPLLTAVETRRCLLGITQRRLAEILQVNYRSLSKWISGQRGVSAPETRSLMLQWLDTTETDAKAAMDRLKDWE
jgi:DNA-binding transcriptional regulator YiaG